MKQTKLIRKINHILLLPTTKRTSATLSSLAKQRHSSFRLEIKAKLCILKNVTVNFLTISFCSSSSLPVKINLSAGLGYFLRRVLEDAIIVRILMKMLMVSMYIPIDLQKNTMFFQLSFGLDFCFQYQPFLMPTRVVTWPYSPKRELV